MPVKTISSSHQNFCMSTARRFPIFLVSLMLLALVVITTGCPYGAEFPLEGKAVPYNLNLVSAWHGGKKELRITRLTADRFKVYYNSHDEKDGVELNGEGYCVNRAGADYIVVRDQALKKYYVGRIGTIKKNSFSIRMLEDENMDGQAFANAKEFNEKVKANEAKWFDKETVYTRDGVKEKK